MTRVFLKVITRCCAALLVLGSSAASQSVGDVSGSSVPLTEGDSALARHLLNRLTFGPRPADVELLLGTGMNNWIEKQLSADATLDSAALVALNGCSIWAGPAEASVAELNGRETFEYVNANGLVRVASVSPTHVGVVTLDSARNIRNTPLHGLFLANRQLHGCRLARVERADAQLLEVMTDFWTNHFSVFGARLPKRGFFVHYDRVVVRPNALGKFRELLGAVAKSPAMLSYLDNSVNSADSTREHLRPYVLPRMPSTSVPFSFSRPGLNENYGRELLELHTMGDDGGFTQEDVVDVARAFTGWTYTGVIAGGDELVSLLSAVVNRPQMSALEFLFDSTRHDAEQKVVLGHVLAAGRGIEDGEEVLDILARHPVTARHIARKLVVRFVNDSPPAALVERAAATFLRTDGDIREVLRTIFSSEEFLSPGNFGAKVKSPLELLLSTRRAMGSAVDAEAQIVDLLIRLDQPPAGRFSPDGWPETGASWITVGTMQNRLALATAIARDSLSSIRVSYWPGWNELAHKPFEEQLRGTITLLLGGRISGSTRAAMMALRPAPTEPDNFDTREQVLRRLIAMALGSPEFQRR